MSSAAQRVRPEVDPVLRAVAGARAGAPLTEEERQAKSEGAEKPWVAGEAMTDEIARRRAGK
ncbi:MAG: hypothetical protein ABI193_05085 [Minicystis sp.]